MTVAQISEELINATVIDCRYIKKMDPLSFIGKPFPRGNSELR
jgi:hypothetical protein